jgi:protein SCO1/2
LLVPPLAALGLAGGAAAGTEDAPKYGRTVVRYELPDVTLVNQDGARMKLSQALSADKPVLLDFFFTSCTTICPVLSASFSSVLETLGKEADDVHVVSIAIDPDHDTPRVLQDYRKRFGAYPQWELLTGSKEDIERVRRAFDAYSQDKMGHRPLNFLRPAGSASWVRIDGLIGSADLIAEYRGLRRR